MWASYWNFSSQKPFEKKFNSEMINPTIPVSNNHPMNGVTQTGAAGLKSNKFIKLVFTI